MSASWVKMASEVAAELMSRKRQREQEWVGLTDDEFHELQIEHIDDPWANFKAIEQLLKERNT